MLSRVRSLPQCTEAAFDTSVSSREIDAEVNRRIRSGEPLYRIHTNLMRELSPDLVITQAHCEVCAVTPGDMERSGCLPAAPPVIALSAGSLDGVFTGIREIASALKCEEEGEAVILREQERLAEVHRRTAGRPAPSVVMLEWTDPLFAMGNWVPELLEIANGQPLIGAKGEYSSALPAGRLREADPEFLIVAPCGFDLARAWRELAVLRDYPWWNELRSVRSGKVAIADGNRFFNRSGMTLSQTAEIMAEILHGVTFGDGPENGMWRWM